MVEIIPIYRTIDAQAARRKVKMLALALGFDETVADEIAIAGSELAFNLVRHAADGRLSLRELNENGRVGIRIESLDAGPGIADVEEAMKDGFSTVGGLGLGLGAVNRLMDRFEIKSQRGPNPYTSIVCQRWLRSEHAGSKPLPLEFGAATRACPRMAVNGDAFVIKRWDHSALVALIDGLGHGEFAHRAAQSARHYVETHFDQPFDSIFRGVGRACRATRGVVMSVARWNLAENETAFTYAGVGNIEACVFGMSGSKRLVSRRGILGTRETKIRIEEHLWNPTSTLVLHSDGVSTHWKLDDLPDLQEAPAQSTAQVLLRKMSKDNDDATVLVIRALGHE